MLYYGYLLHQAGRAHSPAEQRAADARLGRFFAGLTQLRRSLTRPVPALRRQPGTCPAVSPACVAADSGR